MNYGIQINGQQVSMIVEGQVLDTTSIDSFEKLFYVSDPWEFISQAEPYYVLWLADRVWVIPFVLVGISELLDLICPRLHEHKQLFSAFAARCPFVWRQRVWGFIPLFPDVRLGVYSFKTLPKWMDITPITHDELIPPWLKNLSNQNTTGAVTENNKGNC